MTPEELLAAARRLIERSDAATAGVWPRAAALLARQALELAMAALWAAKPQRAGLSESSIRSQLLCLTAYLDQDAATRAAYLYAALSRACHYHSYELAPTAAELTSWLNEAAEATHSVMVRVEDARAHCERAREHGARILMEPTDFEYGERQYNAEDPAGHQWTFSETLADVVPEAWGGTSVTPD
jgi:Glyoxalase/Bleomycin resistance protein/Dioxygenase superfamily